jgi:hypothetical protein
VSWKAGNTPLPHSFLPTTGAGRGAASTFRLATAQNAIDDGGSAPYSGFDADSAEHAIPFAGSAFHAQVFICDVGFFPIHGKHAMRADFKALTAASTFLGKKLKRGDI